MRDAQAATKQPASHSKDDDSDDHEEDDEYDDDDCDDDCDYDDSQYDAKYDLAEPGKSEGKEHKGTPANKPVIPPKTGTMPAAPRLSSSSSSSGPAAKGLPRPVRLVGPSGRLEPSRSWPLPLRLPCRPGRPRLPCQHGQWRPSSRWWSGCLPNLSPRLCPRQTAARAALAAASPGLRRRLHLTRQWRLRAPHHHPAQAAPRAAAPGLRRRLGLSRQWPCRARHDPAQAAPRTAAPELQRRLRLARQWRCWARHHPAQTAFRAARPCLWRLPHLTHHRGCPTP